MEKRGGDRFMLKKIFAKKEDVDFLKNLVKDLMKDVEELTLEVKVLRKELKEMKDKKI